MARSMGRKTPASRALARVAAGVLLLLAPAAGASPDLAPPGGLACPPEPTARLERADLARIVAERGPLFIEPGARVEADIDRELFCAGLPAGAPCVVEGSLLFACVDIAGRIELSDLLLTGDLVVDAGRVEGSVRVTRSSVLGSLVLAGSELGGTTRLEGLRVGKELRLDNAALGAGLELIDVAAVGRVSLEGLSARGAVRIEGLAGLELDLALDRAASIEARGLASRGDLVLDASTLTGALTLELVTARGRADLLDVAVTGPARLGGVEAREGLLVAGRFEEGLTLAGVSTRGDLELVDLGLRGDLRISAASLGGELAFLDSEVKGALRIEGATLELGADLLGARVEGPLEILGSSFGELVELERDRLGGLRVEGCTPADPLDARSFADTAPPR